MTDKSPVWPFVLSYARQEAACLWHWTEEKRQALWKTETPRTAVEHPYPLIEGE